MVSPWTSPFVVQAHDDHVHIMVRVTALDIQVSLRQSGAMLEGSVTSVHPHYLLLIKNLLQIIGEHKNL